jgi:hypothetical protein
LRTDIAAAGVVAQRGNWPERKRRPLQHCVRGRQLDITPFTRSSDLGATQDEH